MRPFEAAMRMPSSSYMSRSAIWLMLSIRASSSATIFTVTFALTRFCFMPRRSPMRRRTSATNLCCVLSTGSGCAATTKLCETSIQSSFVSVSWMLLSVVTYVCVERSESCGLRLNNSSCQLANVRSCQLFSVMISKLKDKDERANLKKRTRSKHTQIESH